MLGRHFICTREQNQAAQGSRVFLFTIAAFFFLLRKDVLESKEAGSPVAVKGFNSVQQSKGVKDLLLSLCFERLFFVFFFPLHHFNHQMSYFVMSVLRNKPAPCMSSEPPEKTAEEQRRI